MQQSKMIGPDAIPITKYGSIDALLSRFQKISQYALVKGLNRLARVNLAKSLNIPVDKLASRKMTDGSMIFYKTA